MVEIHVESPKRILIKAMVNTDNAQQAGRVSLTGDFRLISSVRDDMRGLEGKPIGSMALAYDVLFALQRLGLGTVKVVKGEDLVERLPLRSGLLS